MQATETLEAKVLNGTIAVTTNQVPECALTVTIMARGWTRQEVQAYVEQIRVSLKRYGDRLCFEIQKPRFKPARYTDVSIAGTVPDASSLNMRSCNGTVTMQGLIEEADARTVNGNVYIEGVRGPVYLETINGSIQCQGLERNCTAVTCNGDIDIQVRDAKAIDTIKGSTTNGGVHLIVPADFSGKVTASTLNGSVKVAHPFKGTMKKWYVSGIIGSGRTRVQLKSLNGSVHIR